MSFEKAARAAEAGVGERHVDPPERLERRVHHLLLLLPLGHVAAHRQRVLGAAELLGELLQALERAGGEHHAPALRVRAAGGRGADPRGGARDQQDTVCGGGVLVAHGRCRSFVLGVDGLPSLYP